MSFLRPNWENVKGWVAIITLTCTLVGGAVALYLRLDREVQARMTADQTEYLLNQKVSPFIAEVLRRLERIERKQDQASEGLRRR